MSNPTLKTGASLVAETGEFDLFPEGLFSHLSPEEQCNVKDLLLGTRVEEKDIDLANDPT